MKKIHFSILALSISLSSCVLFKTKLTLDIAPGVTGNAREVIRITNDPIPEYAPEISPDGKKMLFYTVDNNKVGNEKYGIVYMNLGQPGRTPLIGSHTASAAWMHDSKSILYTYMRPAKPVICKGNIDGSSGISYITPSAMGEYDNNARLTPDGKKILFTSTIGNSSQVCMMDLNGNNFTVLTEGSLPKPHPSGNSFLYQKAVGKLTQIFSYNMKTGQSTQLTAGDSHNIQGSYSPDGKTIVFTSGRDVTSSHIFTMQADGSGLTQITTGNSTNFAPTFGSNELIFFCSNAGAPKVNGFMANTNTYSDIWSVKLLK